MAKGLTLGAILVALPGLGGIERWLAPDAELLPGWTAHDEDSAQRVDHSAWSSLLASHVLAAGDVNLVRYGAFDAADRVALRGYIEALEAAPVAPLGRSEQFAYRVNLYNALTVGVILEHAPVASIRDIDISPGLFADGPWGKPLATVQGTPLSLNDIEHGILRPIWNDPRIH